MYYSIKRHYLLLLYATISASSREESCKHESSMGSVLCSIHPTIVLEKAGRDDTAEIIGKSASMGQESLIPLRGLQGTVTSVLKNASDAPNKHFLKSKVYGERKKMSVTVMTRQLPNNQ